MIVEVSFGFGWLVVVQVAFESFRDLFVAGMLIDAARC
jgi:hypothetical protein